MAAPSSTQSSQGRVDEKVTVDELVKSKRAVNFCVFSENRLPNLPYKRFLGHIEG
jgi:hypothetical protein